MKLQFGRNSEIFTKHGQAEPLMNIRFSTMETCKLFKTSRDKVLCFFNIPVGSLNWVFFDIVITLAWLFRAKYCNSKKLNKVKEWLIDWLIDWLNDWLHRSVSQSASQSVGRLVSRSVGRSVGRSVSWLVGGWVGRSVGPSVCPSASQSVSQSVNELVSNIKYSRIKLQFEISKSLWFTKKRKERKQLGI